MSAPGKRRKPKNRAALTQSGAVANSPYAKGGIAPPPDQVKNALAAREDRVQPSLGSKAVDSWSRWLTSTNQPFAMLLSQFTKSFTSLEEGRLFAPTAQEIIELTELAPAAVQHFGELQSSLLRELEDLVATVQGVPLLCTATFLTQFKGWGSYYEPDSIPNSLDHEILAAAVARQQYHSGRYPKPIDLLNCVRLVAEIRNVALTLSEAYQLTADKLTPDDALRSLTLTRWFAVRGASAPQFARATAKELAGAYGRRFVDKLGFRYTDLEKVSDYIHQRWRGALRDANIACWNFASKATGERPVNVVSATGQWRYHYYESLLVMIPGVLSFPISDLNQHLSDPAGKYSNRATAIMSHLGSPVGEWDKAPGPLADSPIRTHPFLIWPDGGAVSDASTSRVLLANPNALDVDSASTMESLLSRTFPADWSAKRAQVVDNYAVQLLSKHLPTASRASGIFVRDTETGSEFEMDGLIVADKTAILVEGKGAPLKLASLRGDVRRLKSQFENLISEAWSQLQRDREAIFGDSAHKYQIARTTTGQPGPLISPTLANVENVHYVIPTLDGLGEAGSNLAMLQQLGILPEDASPWIVAVADLALVVETLMSGPELISYLRFRGKWSKHPRIRVHDEIEMLAMFLEGTDVALKVKAAEEEDAIAFISGGQARFDDYHAYLRGDGPRADRPRKKMTTRVRRVVDELSRVKPQGWFDATAALLGTPMTCAIAFDTHWARYNTTLDQTSAHLAGDEDASIFVARTTDDWKDIFSNEEVLDVLSRREIIWFARRDRKGRLHLEWASHGSSVRSFPRWRF